MFEYDELASNAVMILDKYNLENEILKCREYDITDPYEIRAHIEESVFERDSIFELEVLLALEDLSIGEFVEYLTAKYGIRWQEVVSYRMI